MIWQSSQVWRIG